MAQYSLYVLKVPLNTKQTNMIQILGTDEPYQQIIGACCISLMKFLQTDSFLTVNK